MAESKYNEDSIKSLDWKDHIRLRPGMYIGKLGDGSSQDDGIYILIKEVIDNCIDEHVMGYGKNIDISIREKSVTIRDFGRGIPLGKLIDCVSKINTGAKYDSEAFKKSVGLNGVGTKAVNALSSQFSITSTREGKTKTADFVRGELSNETPIKSTTDTVNGTVVTFTPDEKVFGKYHFIHEYIERMCWNYAYLNTGLKLNYNGLEFVSQNGLKDLLDRNLSGPILYPIIHLKGNDIELALTHAETQYGEEYYSFVNGQHTTQGGTHQVAFREAFVKTIREFYKKEFDVQDIRTSIVAAISVKVQEPVFESQTKTKLGSQEVAPNGKSMKGFVGDFIKEALDNYLHKNPTTADTILKKIQQSEKERKELSGIQKIARDRAKKASLHNRKLRDCRSHYNTNDEKRLDTTLFICEGDSASGSITKVRDVNTQAVFSLKGKPLNAFGLTKKFIYDGNNEELYLLINALDIENDLTNLRFNKIVVATDADEDGKHIRLLLLTFFLWFYPELVKLGHVYVLQTPLFRVRNNKITYYCYTEEERLVAMEKVGAKPEITRFKGLGEISPDEFKNFIGADMRLEPVILGGQTSIHELLEYYMGKNTAERRTFIVERLRVKRD